MFVELTSLAWSMCNTPVIYITIVTGPCSPGEGEGRSRETAERKEGVDGATPYLPLPLLPSPPIGAVQYVRVETEGPKKSKMPTKPNPVYRFTYLSFPAMSEILKYTLTSVSAFTLRFSSTFQSLSFISYIEVLDASMVEMS